MNGKTQQDRPDETNVHSCPDRWTDRFTCSAWQGFEGIDFEATVDLGEDSRADSVTIRFLEDQAAWIFLPTRVSIESSLNGKHFTQLQRVNLPLALAVETSEIVVN